MKKLMVGGVPGNVLGMLVDLLHKIQHGVITAQELDRFVKRENPFESIGSVFRNLVLEWEKFYQKIFNITVDFSQVSIPAKRDGFNWLIIMLQGLTAQKLYDKCKELFRCWKWTGKNLDYALNQNKSVSNPANSTYAIWVRDRVEADVELNKLSTDELRQNNIQGITLEERLLLELFFYWKTKKHLDIISINLCSGSQCNDGTVPSAGWRRFPYGKLFVDHYLPDIAFDGVCSRQVVS